MQTNLLLVNLIRDRAYKVVMALATGDEAYAIVRLQILADDLRRSDDIDPDEHGEELVERVLACAAACSDRNDLSGRRGEVAEHAIAILLWAVREDAVARAVRV